MSDRGTYRHMPWYRSKWQSQQMSCLRHRTLVQQWGPCSPVRRGPVAKYHSHSPTTKGTQQKELELLLSHLEYSSITVSEVVKREPKMHLNEFLLLIDDIPQRDMGESLDCVGRHFKPIRFQQQNDLQTRICLYDLTNYKILLGNLIDTPTVPRKS